MKKKTDKCILKSFGVLMAENFKCSFKDFRLTSQGYN